MHNHHTHSMLLINMNPSNMAPVSKQTMVNTSPLLSPANIKFIQQFAGTLIYYSQAIDPPMAVALSSIVAWQANGAENVLSACCQLLEYIATCPNATICFLANNMILAEHSDVSYLSEFMGKSRARGHYFLTNNKHTFNNGPILTLSSIIKHVVGLAAKAELVVLFYNCKQTMPLQVTRTKMGHAQPKTVVTTNTGLITKTCLSKQQIKGHVLQLPQMQTSIN